MTKTQLPSWAKGVIALAGTAIVVFAGYKIYKAIQKNKSLEGAKNEANKLSNEAAVLNANPKTKATLSPGQMAIFANTLAADMDGTGTKTQDIYKVFANTNNDADVLGIISAFGIRKVNSGVYLVPDFEGTLSGALSDELNNNEIRALNEMLARKGIKYRF